MKHKHHEHHDHMHKGRAHGQYENEVEKPVPAHDGHMGPGMGAMPGMGCMDFKKEADSIALGQAGGPGCKADEKRIHSQFKQYHWD
jgi:hypothetical protein